MMISEKNLRLFYRTAQFSRRILPASKCRGRCCKEKQSW